MVEFKAGTTLTILSIYMFIVFTIIYTANNIAVDYDLLSPDADQQDLGFIIRAGCSGQGTPYCHNTQQGYLNKSCISVPGCTWETTGCIGNGCCEGYVYNKTGVLSINCANLINDSIICGLVGCSWNGKDRNTSLTDDSVDPQKSSNSRGVVSTFKIMYGFNPSIDDPSAGYALFSFFVVWIPTAMMIFCIYMLLPFI